MELIFATANNHKISEASAILGKSFTLIMPKDLGHPEDIPETGTTLEENSMLKCRTVVKMFGRDCFADDTGLEVEALNGAPGVFSARYADNWNAPEEEMAEAVKAVASGEEMQIPLKYRMVMGRLLWELERMEKESEGANRRARFRTVITLYYKGEYHTFEGIVNGVITRKMLGSNGFGYDAVFMPDGYNCTIAQMTEEQKNAISHRSVALHKLATFLKREA